MVNLETVGSRIYVTGDTYAIRAKLKSAGCHWDGDRRQWWIGKTKADAITRVVAACTSAPPSDSEVDLYDIPVVAKAKYDGRTYYVQWMGRTSRGTDAARLRTIDGKLDFWKDLSEIEIVKRYEPRQERGAYGRPTGRTVSHTLGSIAAFIAKSREADKAIAAGEIPDGYALDLEDGCVKPYSQCDIPSSN